MGKAIDKTDGPADVTVLEPLTLAEAQAALSQSVADAVTFRRASIAPRVAAVYGYIAGLRPEPGKRTVNVAGAIRDILAGVTVPEGAVKAEQLSEASLRRYYRAGQFVARFGLAIDSATAPAAYSLTETGRTSAVKAIESIDPEAIDTADAFAEAIVKANADADKARKALQKKAPTFTASDVADAGMTVDAVRESIREMLDKLPEGDLPEARRMLKAIANGYVRETEPANA